MSTVNVTVVLPATYLEKVGGQLIERAVIQLSWLCETPTLTSGQKDLLQRIALSVLECFR